MGVNSRPRPAPTRGEVACETEIETCPLGNYPERRRGSLGPSLQMTVRYSWRLCSAVAAILVIAPLCSAQGEGQPLHECKAADLNATFAFATTDDNHESVIFNVKNI